jgi:hypothetical protein
MPRTDTTQVGQASASALPPTPPAPALCLTQAPSIAHHRNRRSRARTRSTRIGFAARRLLSTPSAVVAERTGACLPTKSSLSTAIHPSVRRSLAKRETFRCRQGEVYLYVEGACHAHPARHATCRPPGLPLTCLARSGVCALASSTPCAPTSTTGSKPNQRGAIVSEFSTRSTRRALEIF